MTDHPEGQTAESSIVQLVGPDHALVVAPPGALRAFGDVVAGVPDHLLSTVRTAAVAAPALQGVAEQLTGGLVRLTADSQRLLTDYGPQLTDNGGVLGVVRGADGRFTGVLTFENVGRLAEVAPQLPALFGAAALQLQLVAIERKLDEIHESLDDLVRDSQIEVLAEARAGLMILRNIYVDATVGVLTDDDWARAVGVEGDVKKLYEQASLHLAEIDAALANPEGGAADRLRALNKIGRNDRARFWFETYLVAEAALAQWEAVRIIRLAQTDDHRLLREVAAARSALQERHDSLRRLADHLGAYLSDAGRIDSLLDRLRIIRRARLDRLIVELDEVLSVYRLWLPHRPEEPALSEAPAAALTEGENHGFEWRVLARSSRERSAAVVGRAAASAGDAATRAGGGTMRALRAGQAKLRRSPPEAEDTDPG